MIKRIELVNFMSHEHSVIDLAEGLTVLVGPNNCGKSAIVAALQVVCYNDNSMYVMRHEAKECSVTIETDDGHLVRWSRKKNGSPRYEIDGEQFDRLGKGKAPSRVHEVLQMPRVDAAGRQYDIHFGTQRSPVFLLNESGSAAADFFASSSDAIRLVEMQSLHKQNVTDQTRERKRLASEESTAAAILESLSSLESVVAELDLAEQQHRDLLSQQKRAEALYSTVQNIVSRSSNLATLSNRIAGFYGMVPPPELVDTGALESLVNSFGSTNSRLDSATTMTTVLIVVQSPPVMTATSEMERLIGDLDRNQNRLNQSLACKEALSTLDIPPVFAETAALEKCLVETEALQLKLSRLDRSDKSLGTLTRLEIDESRPIAIELQIEAMKQINSVVVAMDKELGTIIQSLQEIRSQIEEWVSENPHCPTCGSTISAQQLICGQEHQHES